MNIASFVDRFIRWNDSDPEILRPPEPLLHVEARVEQGRVVYFIDGTVEHVTLPVGLRFRSEQLKKRHDRA